MPYFIRKVTRKNCYTVKNKNTKRVFSKCSTKENAKKQLRLLRAIQYNKTFKLLPKGEIDKTQKSITKRKNKRKIRKSHKYIK